MKKVKHVTFQIPLKTEDLERFKPLYLLSTENLEQSKQIHIFISSSEKSCYIQEKGNWQELIIDDFLLSPKCFRRTNIRIKRLEPIKPDLNIRIYASMAT